MIPGAEYSLVLWGSLGSYGVGVVCGAIATVLLYEAVRSLRAARRG